MRATGLRLVVFCACGRVGFDANEAASLDGGTSVDATDAKPVECEASCSAMWTDEVAIGTQPIACL